MKVVCLNEGVKNVRYLPSKPVTAVSHLLFAFWWIIYGNTPRVQKRISDIKSISNLKWIFLFFGFASIDRKCNEKLW